MAIFGSSLGNWVNHDGDFLTGVRGRYTVTRDNDPDVYIACFGLVNQSPATLTRLVA